MSTIDSVSSGSAWLAQQAQGTNAASGRPEGPPPGPPPQMENAVQSAAEEAGLSSSEITTLMEKLESAMESGQAGSGDPESMKATIDSLLEESGIDVEAFKDKLGSMRPSGPPPQTYNENGENGESSDALSALFEDAEGDGSGIATLLGELRSLPSGSVYDAIA